MWSKKTIIGLIVLTLILAAGVGSVYAYQDKFSAERQAIKAAIKAGDYETAKKIFKELDIKPKFHKKGHYFNPKKHKAVMAALDVGDYSAWVAAVGEDSPIAQKINEGNFSQLMEVHKLKQAGDYEAAKEVWQELGIKPKFHKKGHKIFDHQ